MTPLLLPIGRVEITGSAQELEADIAKPSIDYLEDSLGPPEPDGTDASAS